MIRWMLQDSGLGNIIGPAVEKSGLPLILVAFLIALLVRVSVGSSIVAMTMASGIMATMPSVMGMSIVVPCGYVLCDLRRSNGSQPCERCGILAGRHFFGDR